MSKEIELKMVSSPASIKSALPELLKKLDAKDIKEAWLVNRYFDTDDLLLNKACIALRVREKGGRFIQTLKTKGETIGGLSQRGEWEWEVPESKIDVARLHEGGWPKNIPAEGLVEVFETNFKRTSAVVELKRGKVELAVDDGYILVGGVKSSLSEVEVELIDGDINVLFEVAEIVARTMPVMLADVSKAEKGYRLRSSSLLAPFSFSFDCEGRYQEYVKALVSRNLSRWLCLVDRVGVECSRRLLLEMVGVLTTLREIICTYQYVDCSKSVSLAVMFDQELESLGVLVERVMSGESLTVQRLISSGRAGVLSIELSRWLRTV